MHNFYTSFKSNPTLHKMLHDFVYVQPASAPRSLKAVLVSSKVFTVLYHVPAGAVSEQCSRTTKRKHQDLLFADFSLLQ